MTPVRSLFAVGALTASCLCACEPEPPQVTTETVASAVEMTAWMGAGAMAQRSRRFEDAVELYGRAQRARPESPVIAAQLGLLHLERKNHEDATRLLGDAVSKKDDVAAWWQALGRAHEGAGGLEKAMKAYALDPTNVDNQVGRGRSLLAAGKVEAALALLRVAAEDAPRTKSIHTTLGEALLASDDADAALEAFKRAQELDPGDKMAFAGAANAYAARVDAAKEREQWSKYVVRDCCSDYSKNVAQERLSALP